MTTAAIPQSGPAEQLARRRLALSSRSRRTILLIHLLSAGAWIGIDLMVAALDVTGWFHSDPVIRTIAYRALRGFVTGPMFAAGLLCLISGLVLGWDSRWGLLRYWWVVAKLALNVLLCTLIVVSEPFYLPAVPLTALSLATLLAAAKPWGQTARRGSSGRRRSHLG